ncbi:3-deoxy-manno-octulosonate cytidylyltransferase [Rickettsiaceae bacterium]|nr:3-deoxy-manno-octulosonate cytidylyltransferase [Rickettsiaceae bacterium]
MQHDVAIIIPSRIGATRLPKKPLAKIGKLSLIEHVISRIMPIAKNNLYVATDSFEIANVVRSSGAIAIMTDENCPSGSDRVFECFKKVDENNRIKYIINVQGDMPFIDNQLISTIIDRLKNTDSDIVTPVAKVSMDVAKSPSNVKVVADKFHNAMYFSRTPVPYGATEFLYHVGIYGFKRNALEKFVNLDHGHYEKLESLEQLRALEHGMKIGVCFSDEVPISVDTPDDLAKAKRYYEMLNL